MKKARLEDTGNIEALAADVTKNILLESKTIDLSLMVNILHGFIANNKVEGSLREITRVLKAGGTLATVDFKKVNNTPGPPLSIGMTPKGS